MKRRQLFVAGMSLLAVSVLLALPVAAQLQPETVDLSAMAKIREEGLQRSKGDGDGKLSDRCFRSSPDEFSEHQSRRAVDHEEDDRVGTHEGEPRNLGTVWPRLVQ